MIITNVLAHWGRFFCSFLFIFLLLLTYRILTVKEMPMCVVFTSTVGAQEKTKQNKKQAKSSSYFTRMAKNNPLFGKEIAIGLGLALFCNALS